MPEGKKCDIGLIGLGVMGKNFVLNMADKGFSVAVFNRTKENTQVFMEKEAGERPIKAGYSISQFLNLIRSPMAILLFVPAGAPVDEVIEELLPHLAKDDLVIDCGNSYFRNTEERGKRLLGKGIFFMGMGVSGGEKGARYGPSLMPGGGEEAYERVRSIFEAASVHVNGEPCVALLGRGSSGHYVKMVHNGIEYALMQLISEAYDIMKRDLGFNNTQLGEIFAKWSQGRLGSFLMEITASIFRQKDDVTGGYLIDMILDCARQKGTGQWTSVEAMELKVPAPTIDIAVAMRNLSDYKDERVTASRIMQFHSDAFHWEKDDFIFSLENALISSFFISYTQGFSILSRASDIYNYGLDMEVIARIWRGGCIIRAKILEDIRNAFRTDRQLSHLLLYKEIAGQVLAGLPDLRKVVRVAIDLGIPAPALMQSLSYVDAFRSERLPANLIQAQRDFFGAHTYERIDSKGRFHTEWGQS